MRARSSSSLQIPPVSTSVSNPSFRVRTLSSKSKSATRALLSSPLLDHPKICLHPGESPTLQLLSSRVARFAKRARGELKSKRKSPARVLEVARTQRLLRNRVAMISREVAHVMEETKESFARIRLESICRSKLNAEKSVRRLAKLQAVAEMEHERTRTELQEAQRELATLRAANKTLAAENDRLSEELEKTRFLSSGESSFYVPDFPPVPSNQPDRRSRCVSLCESDKSVPRVPRKAHSYRSFDALVGQVSHGSPFGNSFPPVPPLPAALNPYAGPSPSFHNLSRKASFLSDLEGHPVKNMNPRRRNSIKGPYENNSPLQGTQQPRLRRMTSISFSSTTSQGSALVSLHEPFVPSPPQLPVDGMIFDSSPGQTKRTHDTWVNSMSPPTSPKYTPTSILKTRSAPPTPPRAQAPEPRLAMQRPSPPIPIPPRNPNRPLSAIISVDSRQDISSDVPNSRHEMTTPSDVYHSASSMSTPEQSPVERPLTPLSLVRRAVLLDGTPYTSD